MTEQPATFVYGDAGLAGGAVATMAAPSGGSMLDRLRAKTVHTLMAQSEDYPVPARESDGVEVRYCTYIGRVEWEAFTTAHRGDADGLVAAVLVEQCRGLVVDGELGVDPSGAPLTFTSPELQTVLGATDAHDAVWKLYLRDGDAGRVFQALRRASGWDLQAPVNPTRR